MPVLGTANVGNMSGGSNAAVVIELTYDRMYGQSRYVPLNSVQLWRYSSLASPVHSKLPTTSNSISKGRSNSAFSVIDSQPSARRTRMLDPSGVASASASTCIKYCTLGGSWGSKAGLFLKLTASS